MKNPRVAIVHDYIKEYGGAERVLEALHELYPHAPVYTTVYCPDFLGPHKKRFASWDIRTSFLQKIPYKEKLISVFRLLAPLAFRSFDFTDFDVVIVSATGAYNPNIISVKKDPSTQSTLKDEPSGSDSKSSALPLRMTKVICYCHTPPRYLYGYATARDFSNNLLVRVFAAIANHILRVVDFKSSENVDVFIANSHNVAQRIKKFYRRDSIVVYPPVATPQELGIRNKELGKKNTKFTLHNTYYLCGGRLARPKHIDLIIKACKELGVPLKIFGKGFAGYGEELRSLVIARSSAMQNDETILNKMRLPRYTRNDAENIEFVGEVTDEKKLQLMRDAKAFIMAAEDEDFGIVPVEAMGVGTPVIAYRSGGLKETVINGATGIFFDTLSVGSLVSALKKFEHARIDPRACVAQAKKFSKEHFMSQMKKIVNQYE